MDPISAIASVAGLLDVVGRLSKVLYRMQRDLRMAEEDIHSTQTHVQLLKDEIHIARALRIQEIGRDMVEDQVPDASSGTSDHEPGLGAGRFSMTEESFSEALSVTEDLLSEIETACPPTAEPLSWKKRIKWVLSNKDLCAKLQGKAHTVESTLQNIVSFEQLRVSRVLWALLVQQRSTLRKLEEGQAGSHQELQSPVFRRDTPRLDAGMVRVHLDEVRGNKIRKKSRPTRLGRLERLGFSTELVLLPKETGTTSRLDIHLSLFSKTYAVRVQIDWPTLSFDGMLHTQNMVSSDSEMVRACKTGDFRRAKSLLLNGAARGNDVTESGCPMLDYAIEGGSTKVVRLLLDHGADPAVGYGDSCMTPLQSAFLRGRLEAARVLLNAGADIEEVDNDGFSVLSYLWVTEGLVQNSLEFLRLCMSNDFMAINSTDDRGWTAFHRIASIGTAEDINACLRLGASLSQRTDWYGWTPLFFAAAHDNVDTFNAILQHAGPDILEVLDGDGWNLLHCCVYFGAPRVLRLLLELGVDVAKKTLPAPMPEDPELAYLELTVYDIAVYMGPARYRMLTELLTATGRDAILEEWDDVFWDASASKNWRRDTFREIEPAGASDTAAVFGAEDVDDKWTLLHWASYCGSPKVQRLLMLKGAKPEHMKGITAYLPPSLEDLGASEYIHGEGPRPFVPASRIIGLDEDELEN